jgi:hypothetical protein
VPFDPLVEQVAGLDGRRRQIRDPLLEQGRAQVQLLQRKLGRASLEPGRPRSIRGDVPRQPDHWAQEQRLALLGREPTQPPHQARQPLAPAGAHREQLVVGIAKQITQRGADELHCHVAVRGLKMIDLVNHDQLSWHPIRHLTQPLALGFGQRLPRIQHADRRVDPREELTRDGGVVTVNRPDPRGVDELESRSKQLLVELDARQLHAQVVARIPALGHIIGKLGERPFLLPSVDVADH